MAGLTDLGLVIETMEDLVDSVGADIQTAFGLSVDISSQSAMGQIIRIVCERFALLWQLGQSIYASQSADGATGTRLEDIAALSGTLRVPASSSKVIATLTGDPATMVTAGSQAQTLSTSIVFASTIDAVIALMDAWVGATHYDIGDRVENVSRIYQCIAAGTSAGSGGPTTALADITDGSAHWRYLGEGSAAIDVPMLAVLTGPLVAASGDLTVKTTPVSGWNSVINVLDAVPGTNVMNDEGLRVLREAELAADGTSPINAIRADILELSGVTSCTVFVNNTDSPITSDGHTMPPHSVEVMVRGGGDQAISDQLLASIAAGIATTGTTSMTSTDSEGIDHTMQFSRPGDIDISVYIEVLYDAELYPIDGNTQIGLAIVAFGDAQASGKDAVKSSVGAQAFSVAGVDDVSDALIYTDAISAPVAWAETTAYVATPGGRSVVTSDGGRAYICTTGGTSALPAPSGVGTGIVDGGGVIWDFLGATIAVGSRHLAVFDTGRIVVASSAATP